MIWSSIGATFVTFQCLQSLELVHSYYKLVPDNSLITAGQLLARMIIVVFGFMWYSDLRTSIIFTVIYPLWSVAESLRYLYYVTKAVDLDHDLIKWARYTIPLIIYPFGFLADLSTAYFVHSEVEKYPIFTPIDVYLMYLLIPLGLSGFPFMYLHLLRQRKKALSGKGKESLR